MVSDLIQSALPVPLVSPGAYRGQAIKLLRSNESEALKMRNIGRYIL